MLKGKKQQAGYNIVEIIVTIMVVGVLASMGVVTYKKYNKIEKVKSVANRTAGYLMEAQSLAKGSDASDLVGYQVKIDHQSVKLSQFKNKEEGFAKVLVDNKQIDLENMDGVELTSLQLLDSSNDGVAGSINTITAVSPSGRILFNDREPDLNQEISLYSPLSYSPMTSGAVKAKAVFSTDDHKHHFSVIINGATGKVKTATSE